jgi:[protein-PII] uridylyltransferase
MIQRYLTTSGIHGDLVDNLRDCFLRRNSPSPIQEVKQVLSSHLDRIRRLNRDGASGLETVRFISEMVDTLLRALWDDLEMSVPNEANLIALVAVGGYGRMELCPKSDIDLLILTTEKPTAEEIHQAETVVRSLWDFGFMVGHSVRSLSQCKEAAASDPETYTSFLNERFVAGNHELYRKFVKLMDRRLFPWRISKLVEAKIAERDNRIKKVGSLVQMLEPDIKEGLGCLRDVHSMMWIAKVKHNCDNLGDLVREGLISPQEQEDLRVAYDFLLQVRCCVHFRTGKKDDRLSFHLQPEVAEELSFTEESAQKPVEVFLRVFYHHTKTINRVTETVVSRWVRNNTRSFRADLLKEHLHFKAENGYLDLRSRVGNPFSENLDLIIAYFDLANQMDLDYPHHAIMRLRQAVHRLMTREDLDTRASLRRFIGLCQRKIRVGRMLRCMNDVGLISLLIPDFQHIYCHSHHDIYHVYTTDEHTLTVVRQLAYLEAAEGNPFAVLRETLKEITDREVLVLACIFHDIGKGVGPNHSQSGARMVYAFMEAMDFSASRCQQASTLVMYHLLMNEVIQRRDLDDPKTIRDFLTKIDTPALLQKLYVLTYCDVSSTNPDAWTDWKSSLLQKLFQRSMAELQRPFQPNLPERSLEDELVQLASNRIPEAMLRSHLQSLPHQYSSSISPEEVVNHIQALQSIGEGVYKSSVVARPTHWEVTVFAQDEKGLLAAIAGALASLELSILTARIFTRSDGKVIDRFWLSPPEPHGRLSPHELETRLSGLLNRRFVLSDNDLRDLQSRTLKRSAYARFQDPHAKPEIDFTNSVSERFSTIDVTCNDRIGLLAQVTRALGEVGISVHGAILTTEADKAIDAFYITDSDGRKIEDEAHIAEVIKKLQRALS